MANLYAIPQKYSLPLTKGQDLVIDFKQKIDDEYVDYDNDVTVSLVIDTSTPIVANAVIDGYHAVCRVESTAADAVPAGVLWRLVFSTAGSPSTERVVINGKVVRADGA